MKEIAFFKNKDAILEDAGGKVKADLGISDENLVQKNKNNIGCLGIPTPTDGVGPWA
jgi:hypothetical protein